MATSIFSRKRDLFYLIYFCSAIAIAFVADLQPLYPPSLIPGWMNSVKDFYINTYHDQFFIDPPAWFIFAMWTELFIQIPVMIWAVGALQRNSPMVPLVLLPFSVLVAMSTATCIYAMAFWDAPDSVKRTLMSLYAPYVIIPVFIGVDMFLRLKATISGASAGSTATSAKKVQ